MRLGLDMLRTRKLNSIVPNICNVFMDLTKDDSHLTRIKALTHAIANSYRHLYSNHRNSQSPCSIIQTWGLGKVNLNIYISYNILPFGFYMDYPLTLCFAVKNLVQFLSKIKNELVSEGNFHIYKGMSNATETSSWPHTNFLNTRSVAHVLSVVNINQLEAFVDKKWQSPLQGLFTWRWGTPGRRGNPLRWGNLPVHIISHMVTPPIM